MSTTDLLLEHARVPLVLAIVTAVMRVAYAAAMRAAAPNPRARAAIEFGAALMPDLIRAVLQAVALYTGRPAPRFDGSLMPDDALRAKTAELDALVRAVRREHEVREAWLAGLAPGSCAGAPAELVAAEAVTRELVFGAAQRADTLVPDGTETPRVVTRRWRAPESGRVDVLALVLVLALALVLPLAVAVGGCGPARDALLAVTPGVPRVAGCDAGAQRCEGAVPVVCSRSGRWWPSLPPDPQGVQRQCPAGCELDGGTAFCTAADGGAR